MTEIANPPLLNFSLDDKYLASEGRIYLTGVQALVRLLVEQRRADQRRGINTAGFVSGYPGSPLGGVDIELSRQRRILEEHHIVHVPGLNEDLAATAVFGTQMVPSLPEPRYEGVFGMWFGKAPGVDRTGDAFRHANYRGVAPLGGVLAVAGDDPDAKSTILPSDSNTAFFDWWMPTLFPGDVQDVLDLGLHGYALSRASGLWCGFKIVTNVADGSGTALVAPTRVMPVVPQIEVDGQRFEPQFRMNVAGRGMVEVERELVHGRLAMAREYGRSNRLNPTVVNPPDARLGIVAPGRAYFDLRKALDAVGLDDAGLRQHRIRVMKVGLLFPLHPDDVRDFARGLDEIIIVEDKRPFLELFFKEALYGTANAPLIVGKADEAGRPLLPASGELTFEVIAKVLGPRIERRTSSESVAAGLARLQKPQRIPIPVVSVDRTAYFCSGCPHNRSLVVPDGSVVGAGIGCHIMALGAQREEFGEMAGYTHMGAEGAQWVGAAPFTNTRHIFQNLGDGTFFHSGSLAVRWAVAAKVNITYKLLYNSAVGMTGGQEVAGAVPIPELTRMLAAEGVSRIIVTTEDLSRYRRVKLADGCEVWHRDRLVEAQELLAETPGVTVLIHDQQCAAERRRLRKRGKLPTPTRRIFVNERVCEDCGHCGQVSNCLSVQKTETEFGPKTRIHQSSCNLDYSCVLGDCPSFLTVETKNARPADAGHVEIPEPPGDPTPKVDAGRFSIHMTGIGGTGVVTISQILATAATLDGRFVRDLDLLGSSQKAGPVVSQLQVFESQTSATGSIGPGEADLLLGFDMLGAVAPANLAKASPERTIAVISTTRVPTGKMTTDRTLQFPELEQVREAIDARSRAVDNVFLDAQRIAEALFGDYMFANMILVGAAYQAGAVPLTSSAIEAAIRANGAAVDKNVAAFRWGRVAVADPGRLFAAMPEASAADMRERTMANLVDSLVGDLGLDLDEELGRVIRVRAGDLVRYQDEEYARSYLRTVGLALEAERRLRNGVGEFTLAVARYAYKLMAYKDEYEVARLHLEQAVSDAVKAEFGDGAKVSWNLHPPFLRALGLNRKVTLGPWFRPVLHGLASMKGVRGRPWDPFGWAKIRRVERALARDYAAMVERIAERLTGENLEAATSLVSLPDMVRGYENIKLANVREYVAQVRRQADDLGIRVPVSGVLTELARDI